MEKIIESHIHSSSITTSEQWLVVGAGAIGLLWYSKLYQQGYHPTLLHRNVCKLEQIELIKDDKLERIPVSEILISELRNSTLSNFTHILFCTKAFDLVHAYKQISNNLHPDAHILCLCNGMGAQDVLLTQLDQKHELFVGSTSEGVFKQTQNRIYKKGVGDIYFGKLRNSVTTPSRAIQNYYVADIESKLLAKLAVNATINPLTAVFEVKNGALLSRPLASLFYHCCAEVNLILQTQQHETSSYTLLTESVAKRTQDNLSSMLQDIKNGKKTEIEFITGYLVQQAQRAKIKAPIQTQLLQALTGQIDKEQAQKWLLNNYG